MILYLFLFAFIAGMFYLAIIGFKEQYENEGVAEERHEKNIKVKAERLQRCVEKYGELSKEIAWGNLWMQLDGNVFSEVEVCGYAGYAWCFESKQVIILSKFEQNPIRFESILKCELSVNDSISESTTQKSNSEIIGRAIVGGVLGGGIGAVVGGVTANSSTYTSSKGQYKVCLHLDSISFPVIIIDFLGKEDKARELYALISLIIKRTESNYYSKNRSDELLCLLPETAIKK